MRLRRALLYVPGDDYHKIQKALTLDVDSICLDLEDGVAINNKQKARDTIANALINLDFGRSERLVRVNPVGSTFLNQDLEQILPHHPAGVVLPKITRPDQIELTSNYIAKVEQLNDWPVDSIILIAIIETAQAILNLKPISEAGPRLKALIFGAEDYAVDIGAQRSTAGWEVFYARSALVTNCAAYNLGAIDMVETDFQDLENLRAQSVAGCRMGFTGKQVIHPNQIEIVQDAYTPSDSDIDQAKELIFEFNQHQSQGRGAFAKEGKLIDAPMVSAAESILARARAAGKIE